MFDQSCVVRWIYQLSSVCI